MSSSITEHADDTPTGKLMEAIIESVDEFYSAKILRKKFCGECARPPRGVSGSPAYVPYGYRKLHGPGRGQEAPHPGAGPGYLSDGVVQAASSCLAEAGDQGILDISKHPEQARASPTPTGRPLVQDHGIHIILKNETYTGTSGLGRETPRTTFRPGAGGEGFPLAIVSKT